MTIRIDSAGNLVVVDPRLEDLELLWAICPEYEIVMSELPGFTPPRFLQIRDSGCGIAVPELALAPEFRTLGAS